MNNGYQPEKLILKMTNEEKGFFSNLFDMVDENSLGRLEGKAAANFLKKSGLPKDILKKIWIISAKTDPKNIERDEFYIALRLIALAQNNMDCSEESIRLNHPIPPLPQFHLKNDVSSVSSLNSMQINSNSQNYNNNMNNLNSQNYNNNMNNLNNNNNNLMNNNNNLMNNNNNLNNNNNDAMNMIMNMNNNLNNNIESQSNVIVPMGYQPPLQISSNSVDTNAILNEIKQNIQNIKKCDSNNFYNISQLGTINGLKNLLNQLKLMNEDAENENKRLNVELNDEINSFKSFNEVLEKLKKYYNNSELKNNNLKNEITNLRRNINIEKDNIAKMSLNN
jgi:hypothetical protein